MSFSLYYP